MTKDWTAASGSRPPPPNLHQMKDSSRNSIGVSRFAAGNLHQVRKGSGVSKLPSSSRAAAQLRNRLCWYVAFNANQSRLTPQIKWKCPPSFSPDPCWRVASGEESQEAAHQKQRETCVEEAVYPGLAAIPLSPLTAVGTEAEYYDDTRTPLVSLTPVEDLVEEEQAVDAKSNAEIAEAAATTAVAALEKGDEIDMQLLINILSDPQMVKKLMDGVSTLSQGEGETSNPTRLQLGGMQKQLGPPIPSTSRPAAIMSVAPAITTVVPVAITSTSKPDVAIKKLMNEYGAWISPPVVPINLSTSRLAPYTAEASWVRPHVAPMIASTSRRPNVEETYNPSMIPPTPMLHPTNYIPPPNFYPHAHNYHGNYIPPPNSYPYAHNYHGNYIPPPNSYPHAHNHHGSVIVPHQGINGQYIQGPQSAHNNPTSKVTNPEPGEPCIFFGNSKGCRNGYKCRFKHDAAKKTTANVATKALGMMFTDQMRSKTSQNLANTCYELDHHMRTRSTSVVSYPKPREPCMYFSSFRGCRNGSKCHFKHE